MDWDDLKPRPVKATVLGEDLKTMSVSELEARVRELNAEITRVEAEIAAKKAHEAAATSLFKKK
jgi:uncharacterized small protein (DUF1192 family)